MEDWVYRQAVPPRPTSAAFKDDLSNEVSVFIATLTTVDRILDGHPGDSVAQITAGQARAQGYKIVRDPDHGLVPNDPSHVVLCPPPGLGKKRSTKAARALAESATWVYLRPKGS